MYKNLKIIIIFLSILLIVLLFFYKINNYEIGTKYVDENGDIFLIFKKSNFQKNIILFSDNKKIYVNILEIFNFNNLNIYKVEKTILNLEKIVAIKEQINIFEYIFVKSNYY